MSLPTLHTHLSEDREAGWECQPVIGLDGLEASGFPCTHKIHRLKSHHQSAPPRVAPHVQRGTVIRLSLSTARILRLQVPVHDTPGIGTTESTSTNLSRSMKSGWWTFLSPAKSDVLSTTAFSMLISGGRSGSHYHALTPSPNHPPVVQVLEGLDDTPRIESRGGAARLIVTKDLRQPCDVEAKLPAERDDQNRLSHGRGGINDLLQRHISTSSQRVQI